MAGVWNAVVREKLTVMCVVEVGNVKTVTARANPDVPNAVDLVVVAYVMETERYFVQNVMVQVKFIIMIAISNVVSVAEPDLLPAQNVLDWE